MAGIVPSFVTGANAKVTVGGVTFAYASDVSYNVSVDTIPIETMGRYEAVVNEPVNYSVSGSLSIVRYTAVVKQINPNLPGTAAGGNGLGNVNYKTGGNGADEIDPANILLSTSWDLQVFQKMQASAVTGGGNATTSNGPSFITIKDCRFNRKSAQITKRGILVDRMDFVGILASDDSFDAGHSGDQDLS
jgi:hypothetical protein